ncbi:hypothetical protein KI387_031191, partial [Taxus chinensis]
MANVQIAVAAVALFVLFPCFSRATNYTVGDTDQWKLATNYTTWASTKTFVVGDTLVFNYVSSAHNVLEVTKSAYDSCLASNPTQTHTGGTTSITLTTAGNRYFICGITGHCAGGMKLGITVAAGNSTTPAATTPTTGSSSGPNSAGHVTRMKDVAVLLAGSVA